MSASGTRSQWLIDKSEAVAQHGMVAAMQPQAAEAGAEVLRQGGNAIDAAVAAAFAIGVVEPHMSGVGGIAFMVYRDGKTGEITCFDGSTVLPAAIRPEMFELLDGDQRSGMYKWRATKGDANNTGWLAPGVPGMPALVGEAHRRFGKLPWRDVLQPAIRLAADGFDVSYYIAMVTASHYELMQRFPETARTFLKPSGAPYSPMGDPADRLVQEDLARTLNLIAEQGVEVVYEGEIARMIVEDMARNGGLITEEDLKNHKTYEREPYLADYRGFQVAGSLESSGFPTVVEALKIVEGFDLAGLGFQSPEATHLIAEALRRAMVDRLRHLGDPALVPVPLKGIVTPEYAAVQRGTIDPERATPHAEPGDPWPFDPSGATFRAERSGAPGEGNTTHITVIDKDRNMVALTSTLGGLFGSGVVIKGTGILLNNAVTWFDPEPGAVTSIGPGKRVMSASTPVVLLRDGQPFAALGAPGGRRVMSSIYQVIVNLVDFGLGMQEAISAPRLHTEGPQTEISTRFPAEVLEALAAKGHELVLREDGLASMHFARPNGIMIDGENLRGGVFQYTPATAVGI